MRAPAPKHTKKPHRTKPWGLLLSDDQMPGTDGPIQHWPYRAVHLSVTPIVRGRSGVMV